MPKPKRPPSYRLHKARNCAVVTIRGHNHYLGPNGSPESYEKYARLIAESKATPSRPVQPDANQSADGVTLVELLAAYFQFAETHYRKNGGETKELVNIRCAMRPLKRLYGTTPAADFGPKRLKALRMEMVSAGLSRGYVNQNVGRVKRLFKWAVGEELIPPHVWHGLHAVQGLQRGRTEARETAPVPPVADAVVDATLPFLQPVVADMVRFQRFVGCRPGEVCQLRPMDVDRSEVVWCYTPASHKTEHHGRERRIFVGPKAQAILLPYLLRAPEAYCFSPMESEAKRHDAQREHRKSPVQPSQRNRVAPRPKRKPTDHYTKNSYNRAVRRACAAGASLVRPKKPKDASDQSAVEQYRAALKEYNAELRAVAWSPNQLRHAAATEIRKRFGIEAAQVCLGHSKADVTQVYAERDFSLASRVMQEVG